MKELQSDVVIIGAGIVGTALAYELSHYELSVIVVEKEADVGWGATKANSGIIHAAVHDLPSTFKGKFCSEGNKLYRQLESELGIKLRKTGMLMVAEKEEQLGQLEKIKKTGLACGEKDLEILTKEELLAKEPALSPHVLAGLYAPSAATTAPYQLAIAFFEGAQTNGVKFYFEEPVRKLKIKNKSIDQVETTNFNISTKFVINAAGVKAGEIAGLAGCPLTIKPRAGEEYLLDKSYGDLVSHLIFPLPTLNSKGILAIPTVDHNLMVGPTAVEGLGSHATTDEGREEVFRSIGKLLPQINSQGTIASFTGVRPAPPEGDFIIGSTDVGGFYLAAGMESPGLTAAPAVAKYLVAKMQEDGLSATRKKEMKKRIPPLRLHDLGEGELAELISENPSWGKIVCRCEEVTEAEIIEAIRRGATTLDGIKFRTRLGMGRCQGGFCGPRVLSILARELAVDKRAISKKGQDTQIAPLTREQLLEEVEGQ